MQSTKLLKLTMAIVGVLILIGVSSAQAANVDLEGTTAVWISSLEVDGTYYNVSFTSGNWQDAYGSTPQFDVTPEQAPLFSDKINQALTISRASSVGESDANLDTGFYMIGTALDTESSVSWFGGFYVEELPSGTNVGAWFSEISGEFFEGTSEIGMWANISVIPGSGDQPLDVRKAGDGTGTVTSAPTGLDCGSTCIRTGYMFDTGTSVTLTATPDAGSVFTHWSGCDQTDTNTCTVEMTAAKAVTATFKKSTNAEIIVSWDNGIWYWDVAASQWTQMEDSVTDGDIAAGEFTGDDIADVASSWTSGLWYQDGANLASWTKVTGSAATKLTAGDVTGDGRSEIIGTWDSGLWYWNVALSTWYLITPFFGAAPLVGDIAAGDFTGDDIADVAFIFLSDINYVIVATNKTINLDRVGFVPKSVTAGDVTGDGRPEIIVSFDDGIWYWDVTAQQWTQMWDNSPDGDIAAGDFNGDGFADVASIWPSGLWYQDGATLGWTKIPVDTSEGPSGVPNRLTAGNVTGN